MTEQEASFPKSRRILRAEEFGRILRRGVCVADGVLVLCALASRPGVPSRMGVTIPKKMGPAIVRNRWKRLIRESFRTQQHHLPTGFDFVIRPMKGADPVWEAIRQSVPQLAKRASRRTR